MSAPITLVPIGRPARPARAPVALTIDGRAATVPEGTTMSAGQSLFTPSQNSATSQSPAAPRQRSVLFASAGHSALVPSQTSAMSH